MLATLQKTMDKTLEGISSKFAFLDHILIINKGTIQELEWERDKILKKTRQRRPRNQSTKIWIRKK